MDISGRWEGKLLDASGPEARVVATLKQAKNRVTGEFAVYMSSARDGCSPGSSRFVQSAPVSGAVEGDSKLRLTYELGFDDTPVKVTFDARLADADPHARHALVGSYRVSEDARSIGFEGGACVLWLYHSAK